MKLKLSLSAQILAVTTLALSTTVSLIQPGYTQSDKFYCGMSAGVPATLVRTSRGNIPVIRWVDNTFPPPWTPQKRCEEISERFQTFYNNGTLNFLRAGKVGKQPVLCVASYKGGSCLPNGVLVTLKGDADAVLTLRRLLDRQGLGGGRPIPLRGGDDQQLFFYDKDAAYLDMTKFITQVENSEKSDSCPVGKPAWEC